MADSKSSRLGGLWLKNTRTGKTLYSGKVSVEDLRDAVHLAGTDTLDVTVWLTDEKKTERSPAASLVVGPPYQAEPTVEVEEVRPVTDEDIPF